MALRLAKQEEAKKWRSIPRMMLQIETLKIVSLFPLLYFNMKIEIPLPCRRRPTRRHWIDEVEWYESCGSMFFGNKRTAGNEFSSRWNFLRHAFHPFPVLARAYIFVSSCSQLWWRVGEGRKIFSVTESRKQGITYNDDVLSSSSEIELQEERRLKWVNNHEHFLRRRRRKSVWNALCFFVALCLVCLINGNI